MRRKEVRWRNKIVAQVSNSSAEKKSFNRGLKRNAARECRKPPCREAGTSLLTTIQQLPSTLHRFYPTATSSLLLLSILPSSLTLPRVVACDNCFQHQAAGRRDLELLVAFKKV